MGSHSHDACSHNQSQSQDKSVKNITTALILNAGFAVIELIGGYLTQSTAIQADAVHDLGDSAVLVAALIFQSVARLPASETYNYGLRRLSLLSSTITSVLLAAGSLVIIMSATSRMSSPTTPHLDGMLGLAILGVIVNGLAAWKVGHGHTHNEKALSWHMIEDLLGWVAVLISSIVMRFWHAPWLDPLLAIVIAFIVIYGAVKILSTSLRLLLQAVPKELSIEAIKAKLSTVSGVKNIERLSIWTLDGHYHVCTCLVSVAPTLQLSEWGTMRKSLQDELNRFGHFQSTIEIAIVT
jgi:cobalt-zinc-cadmium efflux system protein